MNQPMILARCARCGEKFEAKVGMRYLTDFCPTCVRFFNSGRGLTDARLHHLNANWQWQKRRFGDPIHPQGILSPFAAATPDGSERPFVFMGRSFVRRIIPDTPAPEAKEK